MDLQDNTFTLLGSEALAKALPLWLELKELNLGDCLLGAKGGFVHLIIGISVIKALTSGNLKLQRIALFFNEISEKGALLVPEMLANKISLTSIELNGNVFDAECEAVDKIRQVLDRLGKESALVYILFDI